ncbi:MAG: VanZ family protein [FCB group bacterium]|nr:VanZ family protein [FCB group bacterium]
MVLGDAFNRKVVIDVYLPVLVYMAIIYALSCLHRVPLPLLDKHMADKLYHVAEYTILGYLSFRAFDKGFSWNRYHSLILGILFATIYGITDEFHQLHVPGRSFSYWDMLADFIGASIGTLGYLRIRF